MSELRDDVIGGWVIVLFAAGLCVYGGLVEYLAEELLGAWVLFVGALVLVDVGLFQIHINKVV
jgi:hypothetical protein